MAEATRTALDAERDFMAHGGWKGDDEESNVTLTVEDTCLLLRSSLDFFESFFFGLELTEPVPEFHRENWPLLTNPDKPNVAFAWPRGYAKSTLAKLSILHTWLFSSTMFCTYTSSTHEIAASDCRDIIDLIKGVNSTNLFGQPDFIIEQRSYGLFVFRWLVPKFDPETGVCLGLKEKLCILKAFGAQQQIRGTLICNTRPQYGVADDIEDNASVSTQVQHDKLVDWFYGAYLKAFARKGYRHLLLGNMLSNVSLLYDVVEKSPMWIGRRFGCLRADGTPLWPEHESFQEIKDEFAEYSRIGKLHIWFAEKMNMPLGGANSLITSEEIQYKPPVARELLENVFITVDPAISTAMKSDQRAICVHGCVDGVWGTVDYCVGRFLPDQLFIIVAKMCIKWKTSCVGIESVAFQSILKPLFEMYMAQYRVYFNITLVSPHNVPKTTRIAALCSLLRTGDWWLQSNCGAIGTQLLTYNPLVTNNIDDLADAAAMGPMMQQEHLGEIMSSVSELMAQDTSGKIIETSYSIYS